MASGGTYSESTGCKEGACPAVASITARVRLDQIRYANCWEDADILVEALAPAPGRRVLSIASAGDNCLALLAHGAEVVAVDVSSAQLACLELRRCAFATLDYPELLAFLGAAPASDRLETFRRLSVGLSVAARAYWEAHPGTVAQGLIHGGRFERYLRLFRQRLLPLVHSRRTVNRLLLERSEAERREFYGTVWDTWRWRLLFRVFFSRLVLGRLGRDPEFFRYVQGRVGDRLLARTHQALTELPTHDNPYLEYILTGGFRRALPAYLRPEAFAPIRAGLSRLTLHLGPVEDAARVFGREGFDGFNLSDIFEYLPPEACRGIYRELIATARPGARIAYWNLLVPRGPGADFPERITPLSELSAGWLRRDKAFFYSAFRVEEVHTTQRQGAAAVTRTVPSAPSIATL